MGLSVSAPEHYRVRIHGTLEDDGNPDGIAVDFTFRVTGGSFCPPTPRQLRLLAGCRQWGATPGNIARGARADGLTVTTTPLYERWRVIRLVDRKVLDLHLARPIAEDEWEQELNPRPGNVGAFPHHAIIDAAPILAPRKGEAPEPCMGNGARASRCAAIRQ